MINRLRSGLAVMLLMTTALGVAASTESGMAQNLTQSPDAETPIKVSKTTDTSATSANPTNETVQPEAIKLGEQQQPALDTAKTIAKVQAYKLSGQETATLYVRNIPVLTFVSSPAKNVATDSIKLGEVQSESRSVKAKISNFTPSLERADTQITPQSDVQSRATSIAARLNQMYRDGLGADAIKVRWQAGKGQEQAKFLVEANQVTIATVDSQTTSPDTSKDLAQDALQVANRLRRLLGNAPAISKIDGMPARSIAASLATGTVALGNVVNSLRGMASWYGPGFNGNLTASGERFNQEDMTAAHPSLPMGTRLQVTNLDTGRSVLVRVNDRGPFHGGRIVDLSAGAARVIGVMSSGVAPVRVDVLGR